MRFVVCAFWVCVGLLGGCSFDRYDRAGTCRQSSDCQADQDCHGGFCVSLAGAELSGMPCDPGEAAQVCYDGAPETLDMGACKAGARSCVGGVYTECVGQVVPQAETCNGLDDDCNGAVDDLALSTCSTGLPGECQAGTPVCQGSLAFCQPTVLPSAEQCNMRDDDCDGVVDDVSPIGCYPAKTGCSLDTQGHPSCAGLCRPGVALCKDGSSSCSGAITPKTERCTMAGQTAADEDCDGKVDEGCSCHDGDTLPCYSGPQGTADKGACHPGTQTCVMAVWGSCQGEVVPGPETCANPGSDDDCNDQIDDVPGVGDACFDAAKQGICRDGTWRCVDSALKCVTRKPQQELCDAADQDCDGNGYNGFDLSSDQTCGSSCEACSQDASCCGGACVAVSSFETDDANCGGCGLRCGASQHCCQGKCVGYASDQKLAARCACDQDCGDRWCCGKQCLDLSNDKQNCGGCGITCSQSTTCCNGVCRALCLATLGIEIAP